MSYAEIGSKADDLRRKYGVEKQVPVPIESVVELRLGISITPIWDLEKQLRKVGWISNDLAEITVDQFVCESRPSRYRFTIAHELGHLILHGDFIRSLGVQRSDDWRRVVEGIEVDSLQRLEIQAYHFAGHLLMPSPFLEQDWKSAISQVGVQATHRALDTLCRALADRYQVSSQAFQKRLKHARLID